MADEGARTPDPSHVLMRHRASSAVMSRPKQRVIGLHYEHSHVELILVIIVFTNYLVKGRGVSAVKG